MRSFISIVAFAISTSIVSTSASAEFLECIQGMPTAQTLTAWRLTAASALFDGSQPDSVVAQRVQQCFPTQVPSCLQRTLDYTTRFDVASAGADGTAASLGQKRPPDELLSPTANGLEYVVPTNIEQIAAERGWTVAKYKSRHAGGFDSETASLLMIYVPGSKVNPPVDYDRWLNIALPADTGANALKPLPQKGVPGAAEYATEASGGQSMPRTFTMVTLDRKLDEEGPAAKVYFQMFHRSTTGSAVFKPQSNSGVSSCYSCHPNGLRAISPLGYHVRGGEEALPEEAWLAVKTMNDAMDEAAMTSTVSWREAIVDQTSGAAKPLLKPKAQGPIVGPVNPLGGASTRTEKFIMGETLANGTVIKGCFDSRKTISVTDIFGRAPGANNVYKLSAEPQVRWDKVRDSMKCATCHNNSTRAALNARTDWSQIDFKILVDQSMPLGLHSNPLDQGDVNAAVVDELTADERIALANCLRAEFGEEQKQLVKWLTQSACQ